jgi:hypothetical protein
MARCAVPAAESEASGGGTSHGQSTPPPVRSARWSRAGTAQRAIPTRGKCADAPVRLVDFPAFFPGAGGLDSGNGFS